MSSRSTAHAAPPWQVLVLVVKHLDPKTLAMSSCVCKSWFISMSSDHIWKPIFSTHFPSLSNIRSAAGSSTTYRQLYALGCISAKRRLQKPLKPLVSLHNLIFTIDLHYHHGPLIFTIVKPGSELRPDPDGVFRFDVNIHENNFLVGDLVDGLKVTWNVVLEGLKGVFTMMDCKGKGSFVPVTGGWFSEELPWPGCCSGVSVSGLVADLRLGLKGKSENDEKVVVEKVGVGVLNTASWRYVGVDEALRYLQHFLMPSDV